MRLVLICCLALLFAGFLASPSHTEVPPPRLAVTGRATTLLRPQLLDDRLIAADGTVLPLQRWMPAGAPVAVVLALHGLNGYANAFARPARVWAARGIATYAYDQRGFGRAPDRGRWLGGRLLADDAITALQLLRRRYPTTPLYLLGDSMGAAIAAFAASGQAGPSLPPVAGLILVSPAVWGRQTMSFFDLARLWFADLMPGIRWSASDVHVVPTDNLAMLRAYRADPLVIKRTRGDTLNGLVNLMDKALAAAPALRSRLLVLYGEHDDIVPPAAVARFVATLPGADRPWQRVALYPHGYHMLLHDLDAATPDIDIAAWISDPAAPLPSGLDRGARRWLIGPQVAMKAALP